MSHPLAPPEGDYPPSDRDIAIQIHAAAKALNAAIELAAAAGIRTDLTVETFMRYGMPDVTGVSVETAKVLQP